MTEDRGKKLRELVKSAWERADADIQRLRESPRLTLSDVEYAMTDYVLAKFMLEPEECKGVDFQELSELSLKKSAGISKELNDIFDTAQSCTGATSAMVKKALLYLSIQKALGVELSAEKTPDVHSFGEFARLIWNDMLKSDFWREKMVMP